MNEKLKHTLIDGIACYSPKEFQQYSNYPEEGFDLTDKLEKDSFWVRSRNRLLKKIVEKYPSKFTNPSFLEIGRGTGGFINEIKKIKDLQITGSEIYLTGLLLAKRKIPEVKFIQFDVQQGQLPETFNLIGAFDVIEHIDNDIKAISNVYNMLCKDGFFIVTVPQYMFLWSRLDEIVKHKRRYSKQELLTKIKDSGFTICQCSSFVFILFPLMLISRILRKQRKTNLSSKSEFEQEVSFPKLLNWIFDKLMRIDEWFIQPEFLCQLEAHYL